MNTEIFLKIKPYMKWIITGCVVVIIALGFGMYSYVQRSIHNERVVHLEAQSNTTRNLINKTIGEYSYYSTICSSLISDQLEEGADVYEFLDYVKSLVYMEKANLILVDSNCNWYSGVNSNGRINEVQMYTDDTKLQEIYITQEVFSGKDCIVCRNRLKEPITVRTQTGTATIKYCGVICYIENMNSELSVAFPYSCNRFIVNSQGGMIYKDLQIGAIIGGSNIFSKYGRVKFLYGDKSDELIEEIKDGRTSIAEFKSGGENYFICTTRLKYNDWYVSYVINTSELASGRYIKVVAIFIMGVSLLVALAVILVLLSMMRIRTAEQLAASKSTFLSNMSHDIRTPINGIMGMTALARREKNTAKTEEYLSKIHNASMHLLSLVNDVLDMSSIENGVISLNKRSTDLRKLPEDCIAMLQGQAEENGIEIVREFSELKKPVVMADELKLRQIILNIMGNAIKFTGRGGRIYFRINEAAAEDGCTSVSFEIEDTGVGMKPEFLEHIWDSYAQEDGGAKTKYNGTGLGMTIVKTFVELMGGTISLESEVNKGSCFRFVIPFESCTEEDNKQANAAAGIEGVKLLLVEDNELNIEIAEELLLEEGALLCIARNGREAVEIFEQSEIGRFDLILMDVQMPEMDGYEASRRIRAMNRADADLPIVAMTANIYEDDFKLGREAGMNAYLSKPLNISLMIKTIAELCSH